MAPHYVTYSCEACGEHLVRAKRNGPPHDWEIGHCVRCSECVEADRQPPPLRVRWMPGYSPREPKPPTPTQRMEARVATRQRVRDYLFTHPERTDAWVAAECGADATAVRRLRRLLEEDGVIPRLHVLVRRNGARQQRKDAA